MDYVVDASVALKWVLDEEDSETAEALLAYPLSSPSIWLAEAANALWLHVIRGNLTVDEASTRLSRLSRSPVKSQPIDDLAPHALKLAVELKHPVYDCFYLALALNLNAQVITADRRFVRAARARPDLAARLTLLSEALP